MKSGSRNESKKNFLRPDVNLREVTMKYGRLVVCIRHDFAEVWGFRYGLTLGIGTLKIMASTGVFVRVVGALKRFISRASYTPCMILTYQHIGKATATKDRPRERFSRGGATHRRNRSQPRKMVNLIKLNASIIELVYGELK
jgi:hypothetical protein